MLDLNKEGNKLSGGKGEIRCFDKIFDIGQLAKFIETTPNITAFKVTMRGIDKMDINNFRLLTNAINESKITDLNFENNTLNPGIVEEISKFSKIFKLFKIFKIFKFSDISKITTLNLASCDIDDEKITKITENLCNITTLNVENNGITDIGVGAIAKHLPDIVAFYASYNCITDTGADEIAKGFKKIKILILPVGNKISYGGMEEIVIAHSDTLTIFDVCFYGCSKLQVWGLGNKLPNCVLQTWSTLDKRCK